MSLKVIKVSNTSHKTTYFKFYKDFALFLSGLYGSPTRINISHVKHRYLILLHGVPIGCFGMGYLDPYNKYICNLFIMEKYRGKHLGRKLFKIIHENMCGGDVENVCLVVEKNNIVAKGFYEKLGYKEYYQEEHRIGMYREIK